MKILEGTVISTKMKKTATVLVESRKPHSLYKRMIKTSKKYHAHDDLGVKKGDWVRIQESRPLSKTKRWQITEVIKK